MSGILSSQATSNILIVLSTGQVRYIVQKAQKHTQSKRLTFICNQFLP